MAVRQPYLLAILGTPDSANMLFPTRLEYSGGNNLSYARVAKFFNAGAGEAHGLIMLPASLDFGTYTPQFRFEVAIPAAGTTGEGTRWELSYSVLDPAGSAQDDPSAWAKTFAVTLSVDGLSAKTFRTVTIDLGASSTLADSKEFRWKLKRDVAHADDNFAQDVFVRVPRLELVWG